MKTIKYLVLVILFSCYSCISKNSEKKDWINLFNGENLDGWVIDGRQEDKLKGFWTVKDGMIQVNSLGQKYHDYVWLTTKKEYADFILKLKFAAFKDSPGNSGVQVRSRYDYDSLWLDGPQVDINPPAPWRTGMVWDETRGNARWLYPDIPRGDWVDEGMRTENFKFFFSTDEEFVWNELEIRAEGLNIRSWLNGVLMTDLKGNGILNDSIHKKFNVGVKGNIALQLHIRDELKMYYKDIFIKEL